MRHLSFSRSTSKRLQKLTAFLVAVAMVAGFLPLGAVKVFADVQPTEAYPYLFDIWTDGKGTVDFDKTTYPIYEITDEGRSIVACSATKSFTVSATPDTNETLDEVVICMDENPNNNIHLTKTENYSDPSLGVSYDNGYLTFEILDDRTEYRGILIFFSGRYQEDELTTSTTLDTPYTIEGGHGARIKNCTLTIGEGGSLTVEAGGNLILEGEDANIVGLDKITFNENASLSFEGGANAPDGITLYDSDGTTLMNGPFDQWEEFCWDGSKWVRMANPGPGPGPANENRIENDFTVNEDTVIGADASWRIVDSTLTIADGASLTVATGGNLILEGSSTQIVNFAAVTFENGASFSFENNAPIPDGVTLYDGDGTTVMNGPFNAWEEFVMDNGKFVRVMQGPGDEVITIDTPIDDEKVIHSGEVLRIDNCELTLNANLVIEDNGKLILERNAIIVNPDKISASNGALIAFDKGASVPDGIAIFEPDGVTPITETSFENYEEFRYDGVWKRQEGPNPNETIWVDDTELNEDYEIHAGKSLRLDDCTLTLNANLIIDDGGLLIFQGGAAIVNPEKISVDNGARLGIDVTAVPDFITVYEADGTTEITDREFDHYEQFIYNDGKWVKDNNPGPGPGPEPQGSTGAFNGALGFTDTDTTDVYIDIDYENGKAVIELLDGGDYEISQASPSDPVVFTYGGHYKITLDAEDNYKGSITMNNQFMSNFYMIVDPMGPGTQIDIEFTGVTFTLEVEGNFKDGTEPVIDNENKKITLTYNNGTIEVSGFESCADNEWNKFELEGDKLKFQVTANDGYCYYILLNGEHPKDNNGQVVIDGIGKDNQIRFEAKFDRVPELMIKNNFTDSTGNTLTYKNDGGEVIGTVTLPDFITNLKAGNPIPAVGGTMSDPVFDIDMADGYVCYVSVNGDRQEYIASDGEYTLDVSRMRTNPNDGNQNTIEFTFVQLLPTQFATISFNTKNYSIEGSDYKLVYDNGSISFPAEYVYVDGDNGPVVNIDGDKVVFTIVQSADSVPLTFTPDDDYSFSLFNISNANQKINVDGNSYSLAVDPQCVCVDYSVSFSKTMLSQATITYNYEGVPANIEIDGNMIPYGELNNKVVNFNPRLDPDGDGYVEFKFSILFIYFIEDIKINGESYKEKDLLPDNYEELLAAFGSQFTNITLKVPLAESYTIETTAYDAERGNRDRCAVGNFLWFYGEEHEGEDDYVKNAKLKIIKVVVMENDVPVTYEEPEIGTAIEWQERFDGDGNILSGEAVLPAGSYVTIQLIPDYGTQLVKLGVNGGEFKIDPDNMYTYTFQVGVGNFHLYATFEPVDDVVETSATAIDSGSISLGADTVDNGTAVLFVDNAAPDGAAKTNFENAAGTANVEIDSYLDISLDKVVYQGVSQNDVSYSGDDKNVWSEELNDLSSPATITLQLAEDISGDSVKILHEKHDGTIEIIDAEYDPETKTVTFETSSFSNYAIAVEAEQYKVTFNANGHGTAPAAQTVTSGSKATKPTDPTASGYTFGGWYTDSACTKAYSFDTAVTANITLYAKWTAVTTPAPSTPAPTNTTTPTPTPEPEIVPSAELIPAGSAHVQDVGDVPVSVDPETGIMTLGTTGQGKRLEEIVIDFENTTGLSGTMEYRVHVQDYGWLPWTEAGNPAGTTGESKRIEAIEIRLTGDLAKYYSVEYCVHIQDYGDMQGWVADGALAGTTGESKRIEQIKVRIVPKGSGDSMSVKYRVHIQDIGWESSYAANGAMSGTTGQSKRLEGIEIFLTGSQYGGGIKYKTHVQDIGWESAWAQNGEMSGTQGQSKRLEGISIELYGEVAEYYDIYYRVHAQDIGWMGWAKNGEYAGTAGRSARLEGIQIVLVPKGSPAPSATYEGITAATEKAFIEGF